MVRLSDVAQINPRFDKSSLADDALVSFVPMAAVGAADGQIDASTARPFGEVKKGYTPFRDGDVLFAKVTPCMENGKMAVARGLQNGVGFGSSEFHVLRPTERVDAKYLYHFVSSESFRKEAARHMTGAVGLRRVPTAFLAEAEMPLVDLNEQRRIVAEIDKQFSRLDEAVANLLRVKANLKRYKAAVLKAAVEGRLVETEASIARREGLEYETGAQLLQRVLEERQKQWKGRGRYKPPQPPADTVAALPEGWVWASIDQLAEVGTGATPSRSNPAFWTGGVLPWVSSSVVNADQVTEATEFVTAKALSETNLTLYPPGTLLLAMYGEGKTRGKCAELRLHATTNQALAALQASPDVRRYLRHFLEHNYEQMRKVASGGVQPNLNLSLVRSVCVPLPPAAEQVRISAEIDRQLTLLRRVQADVEANLQRAKGLRQATLANVFSRT